MTTLTKNNLTDTFQGVIDSLPKSSQLESIKAPARKIIQEHGLPAPKAEEYKFTGLTKKLENSLSSLDPAQRLSLSEEQVKQELIPSLEADILVFNNGHFDGQLSSYSEDNYHLIPFSKLSEDKLQQIGKIAKAERDPFAALNTALFDDGIYIDIPKNKVLEKPIMLLYFNQAKEGQVINPRVMINAEAQSQATFIEKVISLDEEVYFLNGVTEIKVSDNSHLYYYRLQNESTAAIEANNFEVDIHRDATYTSVNLTLQGDMIRNNLSLNLLDTGCEGNMYGLYLLKGQSHVDNHTNVDHTQPHADSNELYKGIMADKSKGVFNGKIFVRQDAQKTNAFQQNNNILLSDDAIVHTKPQLEIWADDVKCSHGCTTGQLDDEALFYLQARGISKEDARGLLLYAFAGEILEHIKIQPFKEYCMQLVQERLGKF